MTNKKYIGPFDWCQNQRPWITLKDHYGLCFKTHAYIIGAHHENLNEDDDEDVAQLTLDSSI